MNLLSFLTRPASSRHTLIPGTAAFATAAAALENLLGLAWLVEARDPHTGGHLWRMSRYAALLCERAGASQTVCARASIASFLHDVGKLGIPDAILCSPSILGADSQAAVRTHAALGAQLLDGHPFAHWTAAAVRSHHERPDGRGYPQGLSGADIPHAALVIGLCDAFDAMTSARPYRPALPIKQALERIAGGLGRRFDEPLGRHFLALGAEGLFDHVAGHSDDGMPMQSCRTCGPTVVLRREQQAGERVYCRVCGAEYRIGDGVGGHPFGIEASGQRGSAQDLVPRIDAALIQRFLRDTAGAALSAAL
jgi:hypothetical protein